MPGPQSRLTLFENRWLEKLTVISARAFIALWLVVLPAIGWAAWRGGGAPSPGDAIGLALAGVLLWTLTEYALHRFIFHWVAGSARAEQFVFLLHGNHHSVPNDPLRNLMPPVVSLTVGGAIWAAMVAVLGAAGSWVFLGFMVGYVVYDLAHYACHQWPMKGRLARAVKTHHMRHHHAGQEGNYAITGMMWDRLFRTRITSLKAPARA
jgi:sterol desaturase/sphingolipid hydroxylase (fatty acid hydroxylase superfamily)